MEKYGQKGGVGVRWVGSKGKKEEGRFRVFEGIMIWFWIFGDYKLQHGTPLLVFFVWGYGINMEA